MSVDPTFAGAYQKRIAQGRYQAMRRHRRNEATIQSFRRYEPVGPA